MARVNRGVTALKRRKNVLKMTKGYRHGRRVKERIAKEAIAHAGVYAFAHRRDKKADFRKLWSVKINAGVRTLDTTYSKFIHALKGKNIALDRKILATIAEGHKDTFERIVKQIR